MIKVGLTGNIGSGKTWVCKVFESLGVPIYYADIEARKILNHPKTIQKIKPAFGNEVLSSPHEIDRKKLGTIVFQDPQALEKLNQLIHPLLKTHFTEWCSSQKDHHYIIQEAAILFENGFDPLMDITITVAAHKDIRLQRVMDRDDLSKEEVLARMKQQWSDDKKEKAADYVIKNDGSQMILPQILMLDKKFKEKNI